MGGGILLFVGYIISIRAMLLCVVPWGSGGMAPGKVIERGDAYVRRLWGVRGASVPRR